MDCSAAEDDDDEEEEEEAEEEEEEEEEEDEKGGGGGRGIYYVWETGVVYTGSWWGKLRQRTSLVDLVLDRRIILRWIFKKWEGAWNRLVWLRIGTGGGQILW
jgi:hypothetical protein